MPDNEPKTGGTLYLTYFDKVDQQRVQAVMSVTSDIVAKRKPDALYFFFSTQGGEVSAGITLHHFLRSLPCEIIMHNTGSVDSIGTVIFLAGDKRYASIGTSFLFHGISMQMKKDGSLNHSLLKERLSSVRADEDKIADLIASRCGLTVDEMRDLFVSGEAKNLDFAVSKSIIEEVREAIIPNDADFYTFSFVQKS